jgi:nicotinamide-nucleotide amidase
MFAQSVLPLIRERWGGPGPEDILWGTALMVPESNLEEALRKCARPGVTWGTRVDEDRIAFSLRGGTVEEREGLLKDLMELLHPVRVRKGEMKPAELLTDALLLRHATLVTAESCTGGLIGKYMTDLPGSSRVFWGGHVSYSNAAKTRLLGVEEAVVREHGAVSEETVTAMAWGAIAGSDADAAIAVTGIAGPDGGTAEKPVGTVWIAVALRGQSCQARHFSFSGTRDMVRRRSAVASMLFAESQLLGREFLDTRAKW